MYLYKSYCYEDLQTIADIFKSDVYLPNGLLIDQVVVSNGRLFVLDENTNYFNFGLPTCTTLGFTSTYTGITTDDAVVLGSSVSLVLVIAWGIKILRRAL